MSFSSRLHITPPLYVSIKSTFEVDSQDRRPYGLAVEDRMEVIGAIFQLQQISAQIQTQIRQQGTCITEMASERPFTPKSPPMLSSLV